MTGEKGADATTVSAFQARGRERWFVFVHSLGIAMFAVAVDIIAAPQSEGVALEFANRQTDLSFPSSQTYRVDTEQVALKLVEHYRQGVSGWVSLGYVSMNSFDHPLLSNREVTGHVVDLGVGRTWGASETFRFGTNAAYGYQLLKSIDDANPANLRWHSLSFQAKTMVLPFPHWILDFSIIGMMVDGVLKPSGVEASNFQNPHDFGVSAGLAWEVDPGGYVQLTVVRFVESSVFLQFARQFEH